MDNNDFATRCGELLANTPESPPSEPRVFYNEDGDCIEFLISDEGFYSERVDKLLTIYYGRDSGEIVGSLIKGVKRFIAEMVDAAPGFAIDVQDGKVRLKHLFTAGMWKQGDPIKTRSYKKLRDVAETLPIEAELQAQ